MRRNILCGAILLTGFAWAEGNRPAGSYPVLVELFTSEGCSSCPPADSLLEQLDRANVPGAPEVIVLSEHVDYWNHIGWNDPYSSRANTARQNSYASRFRLDSVYTPEMVVNGSTEFVGSDARRARSAIADAHKAAKLSVHITDTGVAGRVRIDVDQDAGGLPKNPADVYVALASNEATSQVKSGENSGRKLHHVAVVRNLWKIGQLSSGAAFTKDIAVPDLNDGEGSRMRIVAFVQETGQGKVLGVGMRPLAQ